MSIPRSVAEILSEHVTLELEGIDRMYLNVYVPRLQREAGVAGFFRFHRGHRFASSVLMDPISKVFVGKLEAFAAQHAIPVVTFRKGERKDDVAAQYLSAFEAEEGVLFIGKAQEKAPVFRTERRRNLKTGATYPWLVRSTAMVNQFYVYAVDRDFGPRAVSMTFPTTRSFASTATSGSSANSPCAGSATRRWITASCPARMRRGRRRCAKLCRPRRSMRC